MLKAIGNPSTRYGDQTIIGNLAVNQTGFKYANGASRGVVEIDGSSDSIFGLNSGGAENTYFRAYSGAFQAYSVNTMTFTSVSLGVQLSANQTSWASASDIRLKNVTGAFVNAVSDVKKIDAIRFTWKADESATPCVGLSAQSVQTVLPEAISKFTLEDDDTEYLSVKYTEVVPLLVAAVQELSARLAILEGK
jgi:hypothetical protein